MNGTTHDERANLRRQVAQWERQLAEERSFRANCLSKEPPERQWHIVARGDMRLSAFTPGIRHYQYIFGSIFRRRRAD